MAAAMITMFLIMYWPSRVGVKKPDQVTSGSKKSGMIVVSIWTKRSGMTMRSMPRMRKRMPMIHSKTPNATRKVSKGIMGIVCSKRFCTNGLAGERARILRMPNQKKTIKRPMRATGTLNFLKAWMISLSKVRKNMPVL